MTVRELIKKLQQMPNPDAIVVMADYNRIKIVEPDERKYVIISDGEEYE